MTALSLAVEKTQRRKSQGSYSLTKRSLNKRFPDCKEQERGLVDQQIYLQLFLYNINVICVILSHFKDQNVGYLKVTSSHM